MPNTSAIARAKWIKDQPEDDAIFTYDDPRCAWNVVRFVPPPNRIIRVRVERYKLARYYDGDGVAPDQWEMYGPRVDPAERINLANLDDVPTPEQAAALERLSTKLAEVTATQLPPLIN